MCIRTAAHLFSNFSQHLHHRGATKIRLKPGHAYIFKAFRASLVLTSVQYLPAKQIIIKRSPASTQLKTPLDANISPVFLLFQHFSSRDANRITATELASQE